MIGRIFGVATTRVREGVRGPLGAFLVLFLIAALAAVAFVPGEPGPDRTRAIDSVVLESAFLAAALAVAVLSATSLPSDRESGRDQLLSATPLRRAEHLLGGFLGHCACAAFVLGVCWLFFLVIGGTNGDDRAPTRTPVRATGLRDYRGVAVGPEFALDLTSRAPEATYLLEATPADLEAGERETKVLLSIHELVEDLAHVPPRYSLSIRVGEGPDRVLRKAREQPLSFTIRPDELDPSGRTEVRIRRIDPAYVLRILPGGLVAGGPVRSFPLNVLKALIAWFFGLAILAAAGSALSTMVGTPVATAGTLLVGLIGRSLDIFREAAHFTIHEQGRLAAGGGTVARALASIWPDFRAFDMVRPVTARWNIASPALLERAGAAAIGAAILLGIAWAVLAIRERCR